MSGFTLPADLLDEFVHPDIHRLFQHYSELYFDGELGHCSVEWSSGRMTRLSEPILKLRPPEDLKNTLIHEMIHAYIFLKRIPGAGNDGHGPPFKRKMQQINNANVPDFHRPAEGYDITVYHTMIDEVQHYQQHWWECERCKDTIKRATNRKPQGADCFTRRGADCTHPKCRYHTHLRSCGGAYIKVKEPEPKKKEPKSKKPAKKPVSDQIKPIQGQSTLSDVFSRGKGCGKDLHGPGVRSSLGWTKGLEAPLSPQPRGWADQAAPTVFDVLDEAVDTTVWLSSTSHGRLKGGNSASFATAGVAPRALERGLRNVIDPQLRPVRVMVTARGGGPSIGGSSPEDSAEADEGAGAGMQGAAQPHDGGGFIDLTDDADDKVDVDKQLKTSAKRKNSASRVLEGEKMQISLLSESDDESGPGRAAAGCSSRGKRKQLDCSDSMLPQHAGHGEGTTKRRRAALQGLVDGDGIGDGVAVDSSQAGVQGGALEAAAAAEQQHEQSAEAKERARRRALCAAAADARVSRGEGSSALNSRPQAGGSNSA